MLRIDTILLQYTFYQFQYFIATCLHGRKLSTKVSVRSFNGNDSMVLFNLVWSRIINKLSLIRSVNLFASEARISTRSKSTEQLHSSRWSDTVDCLTHLRRFPVKLEIPMCSAALVKKWLKLSIGALIWNEALASFPPQKWRKISPEFQAWIWMAIL